MTRPTSFSQSVAVTSARPLSAPLSDVVGAAVLLLGLALFHFLWLGPVADAAQRSADQILLFVSWLCVALSASAPLHQPGWAGFAHRSSRRRFVPSIPSASAVVQACAVAATVAATLLPLAPLRSVVLALSLVPALGATFSTLNLEATHWAATLRRAAFFWAVQVVLSGGWLGPHHMESAWAGSGFWHVLSGLLPVILLALASPAACRALTCRMARPIVATLLVLGMGATAACVMALLAAAWTALDRNPGSEKLSLPLPQRRGDVRGLALGMVACALLDPRSALPVLVASFGLARLRALAPLLLVGGAILVLLGPRPTNSVLAEATLLLWLFPFALACIDFSPLRLRMPDALPLAAAFTGGVMLLGAPPQVALLAPAAALVRGCLRAQPHLAPRVASQARWLQFGLGWLLLVALPPSSLPISDFSASLAGDFELWLLWLAAALAALIASLPAQVRFPAVLTCAAFLFTALQPWTHHNLHQWPPIDLTAGDPSIDFAAEPTDRGQVVVFEGALAFSTEVTGQPAATVHFDDPRDQRILRVGIDLGDWAAARDGLPAPRAAVSIPSLDQRGDSAVAYLAQRYRWHIALPPETHTVNIVRSATLPPDVVLTVDRVWQRARFPGERQRGITLDG
jgi:hypothetical protein